MPGRIDTVKSGAVIFFRSSSTITSLAICLTFGSTVLQALEPVLHLGDAALEPCCQGLVGEGRADDRRDDLVQIGQALDRVGERLLVDLRIFGLNSVADCPIMIAAKLKIHGKLRYLK